MKVYKICGVQVGKFRSKEDRQDAELRQLLGKEHSPENDNSNNLQCGSLPWRRLRKDEGKNKNGSVKCGRNFKILKVL